MSAQESVGKDQKILEFIIANPDCSQNQVVASFRNQMAENTVKNHIKSLCHPDDEKVIRERPAGYRNGQPYRLRANMKHPLVMVRTSLDVFHDRYLSLLDKALAVYVKQYSKASAEKQETLWIMLDNVKQVFESTMRAYLMVARFDWSRNLEKAIIQQLLYEVFSKIGPMQLEVTAKVSKAVKKEIAVSKVYNDGDLVEPQLKLYRIRADKKCEDLYKEHNLYPDIIAISKILDESLYPRIYGKSMQK